MADTVWEAYAKEKERLIELLIHLDTYSCEQCQECGEHKYGNACDDLCFCGKTADYLIANGVTVTDNNVGGKWIPVTERLPDKECLAVCMLVGRPAYNEMLVGWVGEDAMCETGYICESDGEILPDVTHWMPLPTPPKGE